MTSKDPAMLEAAKILGVTLLSLGIVMAFAAYEFRFSRLEVLPWILVSFLAGSITTPLYMLWASRPKRKKRRSLDDFAGQVVDVELPTEHSTRH